MGSILCPLGHAIELSEPPLQGVHLYFREDQLEALADHLIRAADTATPADGELLIDAGSAFIRATAELMICPTCGSLLMPAEDPPRRYVPEALTDEEIDAEWRRPPPGWDE